MFIVYTTFYGKINQVIGMKDYIMWNNHEMDNIM